MRVIVLALVWLVAIAGSALAQDRSCEDRLREALILADHHQRGRLREAAEASRAIADLIKEVERLRGEVDGMRRQLPAGQPVKGESGR